MDVRKKFTLNMTVLIIIVVILSVLVFLSATSDPFQQDDVAVQNLDPGTLFEIEEDAMQDDLSVESDQVITSESSELENDVVATVTFSDNQVPEKYQRQEDTVADSADDTVSYTVSIRASWSERLHPRFYPQGAHLSPMIAWSHRLTNVLFRENGIASKGMEIMAETGAPKILVREIQHGIRIGTIATYATGTVFNAPGEDTVQMTIEKNAPYITVVSMIAPSPDWFIAARNVELYKNGTWLERIQIPASLYDAGTDSGADFTSEDVDTDPQQPIISIRNVPSLPIAVFEFIKN